MTGAARSKVVLVAIHLGPAASKLDVVLGRASAMPVEWYESP